LIDLKTCRAGDGGYLEGDLNAEDARWSGALLVDVQQRCPVIT
jgi:hypothetical protein